MTIARDGTEAVPLSDEDLMLRYKDGDMAAFEMLYRRHRNPLYGYLLRGCSNRETAAELFQDVWHNLVRARHRYEPRAKFTTYLYRIAHNRLTDFWRLAVVATDPLDADLPVPVPEHEQPESRAHCSEQAQRLLTAIAGLPVEQREAFLLREEGGLGLEEIAEVTGVGYETVKSRLRYALAKLRQELADDRP